VPTDPALVNPNDPDVAGHIRTWQRAAEPPPNGLYGAHLKYNEWGVMIGTVPGGIILPTPGKPDDVGARKSVEYLWSLRTKLDSVNHCTLEEYVMLRLSNRGLGGCVGRYRARATEVKVPKVRGRKRDDAFRALAVRTLKPTSRTTGPAPSAREAGRVHATKPGPGTTLRPGAKVEMKVYGPYIALAAVPRLAGMDAVRAGAAITGAGFRIAIDPRQPTPRSREQAGTVASQDPKANTKLRKGETVRIRVYGRYRVLDPLRIESAKAFPDVARPGDTVWFEVQYKRLDIERGKRVTVHVSAGFPGNRERANKQFVLTDAGLKSTRFRWEVPRNARDGRKTMQIRMEEQGKPTASRDIAFRVSKRDAPSSFFLRLEGAYSGDAAGKARSLFSYGQECRLIARVVARRCKLNTARLTVETTDAAGKAVPYLSARDQALSVAAANKSHWLWIKRAVVLPEFVPGRYTSRITVRIQSDFGEWITRSGTTNFEVREPFPKLSVWFAGDKQGTARATFLPGDWYYLFFEPVFEGLPRGAKGLIEISLVRGPGALAGTTFRQEWNFGNGANKVHHAIQLPRNTRPGTYVVRVKISCELFPGRANTVRWRSGDREVRIVQPLSNARLEVRPNRIMAGQRVNVTVRCDVSGLARGQSLPIVMWCRAKGAQWRKFNGRAQNGPQSSVFPFDVPANFNGNRVDFEGAVELGGQRVNLRPVSVMVMGSRPVVRITSPRNMANVNSKVITVQGTCSDKAITEGIVVVNGQRSKLRVNGGKFSYKTALRPKLNTIQVQVSNRSGASNLATVQVFAAIKASFVKIVLTWDTNGTDVDLWVTDPQNKTLSYRNRGSPPQGRNLDTDDQNGFGPETYTVMFPMRGQYKIRIQYYKGGQRPTNWKAAVYINERLVGTRTGRVLRSKGNTQAPGTTETFVFNAR